MQELEDKSRLHDIVINNDTLFDFYLQLISSQAFFSNNFVLFWKDVTKAHHDLLTSNKNMLILTTANNLALAEYSNYWQ